MRRTSLVLLLSVVASDAAAVSAKKAQAALAAVAASTVAFTLPAGVTPEMDKYLMQGLDDVYNMDFDAAEKDSQKVIDLDPDHPYGYFGLACGLWTRYVYQTEQTDQTLVPRVEKKMMEAVTKSDAWLKKHPNDPLVLMIQGSAYGLISRMLVMRREWLKAYWYGRDAVGLTRKAVKADPNLFDAYLGIGMYDYYTDVYPRFIGVLAKIVMGGDRLRGIKTLEMVADKGHYSKYAAKMLLVEIYNEDRFGSWDSQRAVAISQDVRKRYPDSAMLHSAELVSLYEAKRYDEVLAGVTEYIQRIHGGKYPALEIAKADVILGTLQWAQGEKEKAVESFKAASAVKYGDNLSRWAVWALIRAGQLEDILGRREEALKDYKTAAAVPDNWGLKVLAKANLWKPFKADAPGHIEPPD